MSINASGNRNVAKTSIAADYLGSISMFLTLNTVNRSTCCCKCGDRSKKQQLTLQYTVRQSL